MSIKRREFTIRKNHFIFLQYDLIMPRIDFVWSLYSFAKTFLYEQIPNDSILKSFDNIYFVITTLVKVSLRTQSAFQKISKQTMRWYTLRAYIFARLLTWDWKRSPHLNAIFEEINCKRINKRWEKSVRYLKKKKKTSSSFCYVKSQLLQTLSILCSFEKYKSSNS